MRDEVDGEDGITAWLLHGFFKHPRSTSGLLPPEPRIEHAACLDAEADARGRLGALLGQDEKAGWVRPTSASAARR